MARQWAWYLPLPSRERSVRADGSTLPPLFNAEVLRPSPGPRGARGVPEMRDGLPLGRCPSRQGRRRWHHTRHRGREPVRRKARQAMTHKEMSTMTLLRLLVVGTLCGTLVSPRPSAAQAQAPKALVITAHNVTAETAVAKPGDVIRYALVFTNVTAGPVKNIQFVDPIPQGTVYVLGSAAADHPVRVEYSIDGGKSYSARPTIAVVQDGKSVEQPAPRERYTHVRWTVLGSLASGAKVMAEFRTQISEAPSVAK